MPHHDEEHSALRKLLPYTTAAIIIALAYVGWIFFSRWQSERDMQQRAEEQRRADAQKVVEAYGGGQVKILSFTASQGLLHQGETTTLCYGVSNAKTVKIDPDVKDVWPSMQRCIDISPTKDTTYTITAADDKGKTESASLTVKVQ